MVDVVAEFEKVLDHERQLALSADVDGLGAIQDEKRALLDQLLASGLPASQTHELRAKATANVQLIRHLVACLQALSGRSGPTYTAGGGRPSSSPSRSGGRV